MAAKIIPLHPLTHSAALTHSLSHPKLRKFQRETEIVTCARRPSMLKQRKRLKVRHGPRKQESRSPRNFYTLNGRAHVMFALGAAAENWSQISHIAAIADRHSVTCAFTHTLTQPGPSFVTQICARGLVDTLFWDLGSAGVF